MSRPNPNWNRWIMSSVYDHFKKGSSPIKVNFDGEDPISAHPPTKNQKDSVEFKHLGPDFDFNTENDCSVYLKINLMVVTYMDIRMPYKHQDQVGAAQYLFDTCIGLYKYGPNVGIDTKAKFGSLQLVTGIMTTPFGTLDPVTRILRTTIEGEYTTDLEAEESD